MGVTNEFPNGREPWTFFNEEYSPDNRIPDVTQISLSDLTDNSFENNFIATKKGDLVSEKDFGMSTDTTFVKFDSTITSICGDQLVILISIENSVFLKGSQFSLFWDENILDLAIPLASSSFDFFEESGKVNIVHLGNVPVRSIPIILGFDVVGNIGDETTIELDLDGLEPIFIDENRKITPYHFENTTIKIAAEDPLSLTLVSNPPTTSNDNNGQIEITNIEGGSGLGVYEYTWSNGATTALIDSLAFGAYTVTVTDLSNGCMIDTTIVLSPTTSANGIFVNQNLQIKITPNPTKNGKQASIQIKSNYLQAGRIEITDALGRSIHSKQFETRALEEIIQLKSDWSPGVYLVSVFLDKEGMKTIKWVVE